ncbi:hypothetical protein KFK09_004226 [Dendrobium nobile]|uniref:Uncharacterized protein n=1 Tax=Dendrobium nobile TaxID=94219 RepID=A0A8T3C568_DENNO|nr:hypothetical protein KFK09_004226 [Dendrobium nobile]
MPILDQETKQTSNQTFLLLLLLHRSLENQSAMEDISFLSASPDFLMKMALFAVIQVLVYLILSNSSAIFSANDGSHSLRSSRSASIRRLLAGVSDLPSRGELTCNSCSSSSACAAAVSGALFSYDFNEGLID